MKLPKTIQLLLPFLLFNIFFSCTEPKREDFTSIQTSKTKQHIRVAGTKVWVVAPEEYEHVEELARYQKKEKLYFQVMEMPASFEEAKANLSREAIEAQGAQVDVYQEIKVNNYDAIYFEGPSKYPGETKLGIWFGNETVVASMVGVCKNSDVEGKEELIQIIRTVFYDEAFELDPFELANFTFNKDSFDFEFNTKINTMFIFSPNGAADTIEHKEVPGITIAPLPFMSKDAAQNYTNELIQRYETQQRATFLSEEITELELADQTALVLKATIEMEGQVSYLYQTIILGEESSLLFIGTCAKDVEPNMNAFERAVRALRFKDVS